MEMKQSSHDLFEDIKHLFLSINAPDMLERNVPIINDKQFYRYAEGKPSYNKNQSCTTTNK